VDGSAFDTATLAMDDTGDVFILGSSAPGSTPMVGKVGTGRYQPATGTGDVVAAAFGPDRALRLVLDDDHGLALITCTNQYCAAR
jgi:hypothetical protein